MIAATGPLRAILACTCVMIVSADAQAQGAKSPSVAHTLHSEEKKLEALIGRLERWLNKPI